MELRERKGKERDGISSGLFYSYWKEDGTRAEERGLSVSLVSVWLERFAFRKQHC